MKNKICRYCGADVTRTVPNCPVCGKSIAEIREIGNDRSKQSEKEISKNSNKAVKITIIAFVFMMLVATLTFILVKDVLRNVKGMVKSIPELTKYKVGERYDNNAYSITYVSNDDYSQYLDPATIVENYKIIRYQLSIFNKSNYPINTSSFYFKCVSDDIVEDSYSFAEDSVISKTIEAGTAEEFIIYCEAPINSVNNKLEAKLDYKIYFISE